jgi:hypothetical protein
MPSACTPGRKTTSQLGPSALHSKNFARCWGWIRLRTLTATLSEKRVWQPGRISGQRALNVAIAEINAKTELNIALKSLEQGEHGRVMALIFAIKA